MAQRSRPTRYFPDLRKHDEEYIFFGGDFEPETLLDAYRHGIFPWPCWGISLVWTSPQMRGVLEFDNLHIPKSLRQARARTKFHFTIDKAFPEVIRRCARIARPDNEGTWITSAIQRAFLRLHQRSHSHSVEAWDGDRLVGGFYGVDVDGVFAGESMFHVEPNASKLALLFLIDYLRERGSTWLDIQMLTPHMEVLGARDIPRHLFLEMLADSRRTDIQMFDPVPPNSTPDDITGEYIFIDL